MDSSANDAKREVNLMMREGLRSRGDDRPIAFFCECSDRRCYQAVWLTGAEFDEACGDEAWRPLVDGHAAERPRLPVACEPA